MKREIKNYAVLNLFLTEIFNLNLMCLTEFLLNLGWGPEDFLI